MRRFAASVVVVLSLVGIVAMSTSAAAETSDPEGDAAPLIVEVMAEVPGGVLLDPNRAVWPELGMELFVPPFAESRAASAGVGACADGQVCVFAGASLGGAKLSWSVCGIHTLPSTFRAKSIADARSAGYAQARSGTTVLATAAANAWANITGVATNVRCVF